MTFLKVRYPRVPSSQASARTVKERTREMENVREMISAGDTALQLSSEIYRQTCEERKQLLDELLAMPGNFRVQISASDALAVKSSLQIPWTKLRVMRRYTIRVNYRHVRI